MQLDLRLVRALFAALGGQVGAFAVLTPDLARTRGLDPAALGLALGALSLAAIATLALGGRFVADRHGPRPLALAGIGLVCIAFLGLAALPGRGAVLPTLVVLGVASGCLDLGANAAGARAEALHGARRMVGFHAFFSGAAAVAALGVAALRGAGVAPGAAYGAVACAYGLALVAVVLVARGAAVLAPTDAAGHHAAAGTPVARGGLLRVPGVRLAVVICTLCFLGDGMIESFAALVLREALGSGVLLAGLGVGGFHLASLAGRVALARVPPRPALVGGGVGAAAGVLLIVLAPVPAVGAAGLLLVGFALAPVVPTTLSLAAAAAPGRPGAAVSTVTSVGSSAFVAGPPLAGAVAGSFGLGAALVPVIVTALAFAAVSASVRS